MAAHTHFSISALSATIAIRRYISDHPEASAESAAVPFAGLTPIRRRTILTADRKFMGFCLPY